MKSEVLARRLIYASAGPVVIFAIGLQLQFWLQGRADGTFFLSIALIFGILVVGSIDMRSMVTKVLALIVYTFFMMLLLLWVGLMVSCFNGNCL